jgi:energy-coupling factor transporter ATP-binding protein EcfA2
MNLENLEVDIAEHENLMIRGPMGSGKTTLLKYLKEIGYNTFDDKVVWEDLIAKNRKEYEADKIAFYAKYKPSFDERFAKYASEHIHGDANNAVVMWGDSLPGYKTIYIDVERPDIIANEREGFDEDQIAEHFDTMRHGLETHRDNIDYILDEDSQKELTDWLEWYISQEK